MEPEEAFGPVLRELRRARHLSQEELAEMAECTRPYISYLETGKHTPTIGMLFKLARALGLTPADLVTLVEEKTNQ